jgi:hypothetical protein
MMLFALPYHRDRDFHFQPNLAHRKTIRCGWPGHPTFFCSLNLTPDPATRIVVEEADIRVLEG